MYVLWRLAETLSKKPVGESMAGRPDKATTTPDFCCRFIHTNSLSSMRWIKLKPTVAAEPEIAVYYNADALPVSHAVACLPVEDPCFREPLSPPGYKAPSLTTRQQATKVAEDSVSQQNDAEGLWNTFLKGWNEKCEVEMDKTSRGIPPSDDDRPNVVLNINCGVPLLYCVLIVVLLLVLIFRRP